MTLGNLRRAAGLIGNFKQIAVDQASEARREVSLGPYVREVVASLGPMYRRTPHHVNVDVINDAVVTTYVGAISQVCTNLVQNALVHAFPDEVSGQITLTVDRHDDGGALLLCRDDGAGMEATVLRRIYEPFFTTQRGRGGSGLGMHIVHNLVTDLLGGSIDVESSQGQGTTVTIHLPAVPEPPAQALERT
jgi:signal transduction histidine kinase